MRAWNKDRREPSRQVPRPKVRRNLRTAPRDRWSTMPESSSLPDEERQATPGVHCRENFDAFRAAAAKAPFVRFGADMSLSIDVYFGPVP